MTDVDGLNAGFARDLLEDYLENPEAVPSEWRELFESGDSDVVATHPGLARLLERAGNGHHAPAAEAPAPAPAPAQTEAPPVTDELLGAVARRTAARSRTSSSTSPTTRSACGCDRRSSRASTAIRSQTRSARSYSGRSRAWRRSSSTCGARSSARSSSRSRGST